MRTIFGALFILSSTLQAQQTPEDRSIREFMTVRAKELERDFLPEVRTASDFEALRPKLHRQYLDMLGLWPLPEKTPLKATVTGTVHLPGVKVELLHYQSKPGLYVTANLYFPDPCPARCPAIVYQCGHSNMKRDGNKTAYQDHGIWFAQHGYVCLVTDTHELGEVNTTHHGTYSYQRWWWHSAGFTPAGVECWNAIRGIDYLVSRPEVDPDRIGATGISGGGAATGWISAADDRIKASAPVSGMSDLTWYVGEDGVNGHCDCMFLYNNYRWNWTTIAALVCPRPLLFVNSDDDKIFPMPANERIINRLERLYSKFGVSDKVDAMVSVGGHAYRTDLRRAVFEFFNRTLKQDAKPVLDADSGLGPDAKTKKIEPFRLRVFPDDKDIPADSLNTKIDEMFLTPAKVELPTPDRFETWKQDLIRRLEVSGLRKGDGRALTSLTPILFEAGEEVWTVVLNATDPPSKQMPSWAAPIVDGRRSCIVQPSTGWTRKNPPNTVERSLALLGMTADSLRVSELIAAPPNSHFVGKGEAGILAAYAALLRPEIRSVTIVDPPTSHRQGPQFLGILKICDIPEALGALAPRPLTLINAKDPAFDRTAELYRLAGAADKLVRK
ncbi:MAG TPA: prolyl oligopeptidase family serine peptidase [Planctomycetota bacterium]|nr:prolyl oligopeptidase family serine peptidase [Planctomycetota bacterium]